MADTAARLAISARRNEVARFTIAVTGIDLTGVAMAMQVRQTVDNPYLLFALGTVNTLAAEGLKLDSVTTTNGVPTSIIKGRINASTMTDAAKVPYVGEVGTDSPLAYAMQWTLAGDAQTRLYGDFIVVGSAFGSDGAPTNRPPSYGGSSATCGGSSSGSLSFGDQIIAVTLASSDLVGLEVAKAIAAAGIATAASTQTSLDRAQTSQDRAATAADRVQTGNDRAVSTTERQAIQAAFNGNVTPVAMAVPTRAVLAAAAGPTDGLMVLLGEGMRTGVFRWTSGDFTARRNADPLQGVYVPHATIPITAGCFVREGERLSPFFFGALTNYATGDRTLGTYGESQTPGLKNGILVDSRAECQAMLNLIASDQYRKFIGDFSGGLWGISAGADTDGLVINQPQYAERKFIGGEFRGIGSGRNLIRVQNGAYSSFEGIWHIRSGADLGSSYGYASRKWSNGIWLRGCAQARWALVKVAGFKRWGIDTDPQSDPTYNNNIGCRFERIYANNCGSTVDRAGNNLAINYTASERTGGNNSTGQRTKLTLDAGYEDLQLYDVVRSAAGSYHVVMEIAGNVFSLFPWLISTATTGTIASAHGGALHVVGKDTAGFGCDHLSSISNGCGLRLEGQHASNFGGLIIEGGGLGIVIGVVNGASIGHDIQFMHQEGNSVEILALTASQTSINIGESLIGTPAEPFSKMEVVVANDGATIPRDAGLPWLTIHCGGVVYQSGRNTQSYNNTTKSRSFYPTISNDPSTNRLRKVANAVAVELKYYESFDRMLRDSFVATLEVIGLTTAAPSGEIRVTLNVADAAAGVTIEGGAGPYIIAAGTATGPVLLNFWLDTSTSGARNWRVIRR